MQLAAQQFFPETKNFYFISRLAYQYHSNVCSQKIWWWVQEFGYFLCVSKSDQIPSGREDTQNESWEGIHCNESARIRIYSALY